MLADLTEFVDDHRPHGPLTADATEPAWNGYLLTVAWLCGVTLAGGRSRLSGVRLLAAVPSQCDPCQRG